MLADRKGSVMKSVRKSVLFALLVLAIGLALGSSAQAQSMGTFTLPVAAHWGKAYLPAGDYSYSVQFAGASTLVQIRGEKGLPGALILASSLSAPALVNSPNRLTLEKKAGETYVSSLSVSEMGVVLYYEMPKAAAVVARAQDDTRTMAAVQPAK